jgi:hypothetical protein
MARPTGTHGPERQALTAAMREVCGTSRTLAERANVGYDVARMVLDNMVRAEQAVKATSLRVAGVKRPVPVYALAEKPTEEERAAAVGAFWLSDVFGPNQ